MTKGLDHGLDIKLVVVGDGGVGKTCLLTSYCKDEFPTEHVPTVFETFSTALVVDMRSVQLTLWDTAGQEGYDKMRPLSYPDTDVFLVCFSLINSASLENVERGWVPELRNPSSSWGRVPILLVGLKKDLRDPMSRDAVKTKRGMEVAERISAAGYMECSAKTREGLNAVFEEAIRAILTPKGGPRGGRCNNCTLL